MTDYQLLKNREWEYKYQNDISGTRYLAFKSQRLLSTGILSLDSVIGGGIPLGTIFLVEDDDLGIFGKILLKHFFANGSSCKHSLFVGSYDLDSHSLLTDRLPENYNTNLNIAKDVHIERENDMYSPIGQHISHSNNEENVGMKGDIKWDDSNIIHWPLNPGAGSQEELLSAVCDFIVKKGYPHETLAVNKKTSLLRIGLHGVGSNLWPDSQEYLPRFFYNLRAILCNSFSAAMVTVPKILIKDRFIIERCQQLSDCVIKLELLTDKNPLFSEYSGLINVVKLPTFNTIAAYHPEDSDWGIKLRRKRIIVERLHLPPELQSTIQREQDDTIVTCGEINSNKLEF